MTEKRTSHKRYQRPATTPNVAITADDGQIMLALSRFGVLDSEAVYRMFPGRSRHGLSNRLKLLFRVGYLHRLGQLKSVFVPGGGSRPDGYVLDSRGLEWLSDEHDITVPERHLHLRERSGSYLLHDIEATRFILGVRAAVSKRSDVEFLFLEDYYRRFLPEWLTRDIPLSIQAPVMWFRHQETEGTIPDFLFVLYYPQREVGRQFRSVALEYCRGTETIEPGPGTLQSPKFWKQSSLLRKFVIYAYAIKSNSFRQAFGMPLSHVLTVTTTNDKVARMQMAYQNYLAKRPHQLRPVRLLFTSQEALKDRSDFMGAPIWDGAGSRFNF